MIADFNLWKTRLQKALQAEQPYGDRKSSFPDLGNLQSPVSEAAVLIHCSFSHTHPTPEVLLTRRSSGLASHQGQFAFPGGVIESGEDATHCALREAQEEVGIQTDSLEVLGILPALPTLTTGFRITPVLALSSVLTRDLVTSANPSEVEEIFWLGLDELEKPLIQKTETLQFKGKTYVLPVFHWQGRRIWGATAAILWNLSKRLRTTHL